MPEALIPPPESTPQLSRDFRLDEVLTVVSGVNFIDTKNDRDPNAFTRRIGDLLSYATNEGRLETFQLPRIADEVSLSVVAEHPELAELLKNKPEEPLNPTPEEEAAYEAAIRSWHETVIEQYGDKMANPVAISPISPEDHTHIDAKDEFQLMGGKTFSDGDIRRLPETDIRPGAGAVVDDESQNLLDQAIPGWERLRAEILRTSGEAAPSESTNANPGKTLSAEEWLSADLAWPDVKDSTPSDSKFRKKAYEQGVGDQRNSGRDDRYIKPAAQWTRNYETPAGNLPARVALAYRISKATDDDELHRVMAIYAKNPDSPSP